MKYRLIRVLFLLLIAASASAKPHLGTFGHDFFIAHAPTSFNCPAVRPYQTTWVIISAPYDCSVQVFYFDHLAGVEFLDKTVSIKAKSSAMIALSLGFMGAANVDGEVPEFTACHIHADNIVTVSYYSTGPDNGAMYLALPVAALGRQYVVAAAPNNDGTGAATNSKVCSPEPSSSEFAVIAVEDNTHVAIFPSGTTRHTMTPGATSGPGATGTPNIVNVILNRGQVYWVKSEIKTNPGLWDIDMTGSQISSDNPVAVIAGSENSLNQMAIDGYDDQRNLSIQMMVAVEYWASKGYVAMPMHDTPGLDPNNNSYGDLFRVIAAKIAPAGCKVSANLGELGERSNAVTPYQFPPLTYDNVGMGALISSPCDQKIFVEQYDYRTKGDSLPYTAPCQMNVVPIQNFAHSAMWTVPDDPLKVAKFRFINVIANPTVFSKIKLYKDGKLIGNMSSLASAGSTVFPNPYDHLVGHCYSLDVGTYYAKCDSDFCVYQYGMTAFDVAGRLGDNDGDDYYTEYATACGQTFGIDGGGVPSVTVDTLCEGRPFWQVHVRDTAAIDNYISDVEFLIDPIGVVKRRPDADSGYTSYNVAFDPPNFTLIPGTKKAVDVKIVVRNPLKKAEAWVWAVNGAGNDTLVHLVYLPPALEFGATTSKGVDQNGDARISFMNSMSGIDTCSQFVLKNSAKPGSPGATTFTVSNVRFQLGGQGFAVSSTTPPLPARLAPGDSVVVHVCFNSVQSGRILMDTLYAETECPLAIGYLSGSIALPEITAVDYNFGTVAVGDSSCHAVRVSNTGTAAFTLTKDWIMTNYVGANFHFNGAGLPFVVQPGASVNLTICYVPTAEERDSSVITWGTDMQTQIKENKKNYSVLVGQGIVLQGVHAMPTELRDVRVTPNPVTDEVTVSGSFDRSVSIEVLDLLGNRVVQVSSSEHRKSVDAHAWPAGVYFVRVSTADGAITKRIVKR
jgi:hypothetical protein